MYKTSSTAFKQVKLITDEPIAVKSIPPINMTTHHKTVLSAVKKAH